VRLPRLTAVLVAAAAALPQPARASPEWHAGIQPALALDFEHDARWAFDASADVDVLFGRERAGTVGYGPAVEFGTWAFRDLRLVPMARLLVPVGDLDLAASAGPRLRFTDERGVGMAGRVSLGYRAFNHTGAYGTAFALFGGVDQRLDAPSATWSLGIHFDAMWASLPFVALASWVRGDPDD
jgi:hypothetical protein